MIVGWEFEMKSIKFIGFFFICLLAACSDSSTNTAGVLSETESGETASTVTLSGSLYYYDLLSQRNYSGTIVALTRVANGRTTLIDSTTTDSTGNFTFVNAPTDGYGIVATLKKSDSTFASFYPLTPENYNKDSTLYIEIAPAATIMLSPHYNGLSVGDTICITGMLSCTTITNQNKDDKFIEISGIPATRNGPTSTSITQIEIANKNGVRNVQVDWNLTINGTLVIDDNVLAKIDKETIITLPKIDEMDSLSDKTLDSLIVPVFLTSDHIVSYTHDNGFMDENNSVLPWVFGYDHSYNPDNSISNYKSVIFVTIPSIKASATIKELYGEPGSINVNPDSRIRLFSDIDVNDTIHNYRAIEALREAEIFTEDSSFAFGFWITLDGESLTENNNVLLSSKSSDGKMGFEIRQCENEKQSLCTRIYNGQDTSSTDNIEFGEAKILDGEQHYYSVVIHKKHLDIGADGKSIRSTDLKLADKFYELKGLLPGEHVLTHFTLYSFGDFIRKADDKNWERLKAWQRAFYELQKNAMETTFDNYLKL